MVKNPPANAGDMGSIPGLGRSPRGGHDNPLQYSCLENTMDEQPEGLQSMGSHRVSQTRTNTHPPPHTEGIVVDIHLPLF